MLTETPNLTPVGKLGEFELIRRLTSEFTFRHPERIVAGIGDDCAVLTSENEEYYRLFSTDLLTEGVHFDLTYVPMKHLGYKAVAVNVSDIYAMNGTPEALTVGLAVSSRFSVEALEELYAGIRIACEEFNCDLVGGDTVSSRSGLMIAVTVWGSVNKNEITYRSGAGEYDILCITGDAGAAYAGLQILEREKKVFTENPSVQPDFSTFEYVIERQLRPHIRKEIIELFKKEKIVPTSMIDVSDGIASEIHHLCAKSRTGAAVYRDKIPTDYQTEKVAELIDVPSVNFALFGGEDYELLFTVKQSDFTRIANHPLIHPIGHITSAAEGIRLVHDNGSQSELKPLGFNHFA